MKKKLLILSVTMLCSCCAVKETDQDNAKRISDLTTSNWMLRVREAQKDSIIIAYQDSLRWCREDNTVVK